MSDMFALVIRPRESENRVTKIATIPKRTGWLATMYRITMETTGSKHARKMIIRRVMRVIDESL
jgi:hypothetical protein